MLCLIYLWLLAPLLHHLEILSCKPHNLHWDVCTYSCIHVWTRIVTCQRVYQFLTTVCATTSFSRCFQLNCWLYIINPNPSTTTSFSMLPVWTLGCTWKNTPLLEVSTAFVVHRSHIMSFSGGLVEWSDDDYSSAYAESLLVDFCYDGGRTWVWEKVVPYWACQAYFHESHWHSEMVAELMMALQPAQCPHSGVFVLYYRCAPFAERMVVVYWYSTQYAAAAWVYAKVWYAPFAMQFLGVFAPNQNGSKHTEEEPYCSIDQVPYLPSLLNLASRMPA